MPDVLFTGILRHSITSFAPSTHGRSDQEDINDEVTYTVLTKTLYKGEPTARYAQDVQFLTGGNSATCGVSLKLGEEYLIGLYRINSFDPDRDGQLTVGLCDLVQVWSAVTDGDKATLDTGCDDTDPCSGSCGDSQVLTFGWREKRNGTRNTGIQQYRTSDLAEKTSLCKKKSRLRLAGKYPTGRNKSLGPLTLKPVKNASPFPCKK